MHYNLFIFVHLFQDIKPELPDGLKFGKKQIFLILIVFDSQQLIWTPDFFVLIWPIFISLF